MNLRRLIPPKVQRLGRRAVDLFPLTPAGSIILSVCAMAFFFVGIKRLDLVVLTASLFIAGILLLVEKVPGT